MKRRGKLCGSTAVAIALLTAPASAFGAEITRAQYVERAEAICKVGTTKVTPALRKGMAEIKDNQVKLAGPRLVDAAATYDSSRARLVKLPKPAADAAALTSWLKLLEVQNSFLKKAGEALRAEERVRAQGLLSRFVHNGNLANDEVLGFGFKACLFENRFK